MYSFHFWVFLFYIFVAPCLSLGICFLKHFISRRLPPVASWGRSRPASILVQITECVWQGPLHSAQSQPYGFLRQCVRVSGGGGEEKIALRMPRASKEAIMFRTWLWCVSWVPVTAAVKSWPRESSQWGAGLLVPPGIWETVSWLRPLSFEERWSHSACRPQSFNLLNTNFLENGYALWENVSQNGDFTYLVFYFIYK